MPTPRTLALAAILALPGAAATAQGLEPLQIGSGAACPDAMPLAVEGQVLGCWCDGTGGGQVWGTGVYTNDSDLCTAALHTGAVGADGGAVLVQVRPGEDGYRGSSANGVTSANYGPWDGSIMFLEVPEGVEVRKSGWGN